MLGIDFPELLVCFIVALVLIGPEQLPGTVRTIGLWIGRLKRSVRNTREEFERQVGMDDIRRQLHNEEIMRALEDARKDFQATIDDQKNTIHEIAQQTENIYDGKIYGSEPDLPYHSHMDDPHHGSLDGKVESLDGKIGSLDVKTESVQEKTEVPPEAISPTEKKSDTDSTK